MSELLANPLGGTSTVEGARTLALDAYRALRRDIIEGRLAPGTKLRVEHLRHDYNVGAGTLREALALLGADALVTAQGQKGFRVAPMSLEDFHDITETRVDLEARATKLSVRQGGDAWEAALTAAFHLLSLAEQRLTDGEPQTFNAWEDANKRFHSTLISECRSGWTQYLLGILYIHSERYRRLLLVNRPLSRDVHNEHRRIFEAALARDAVGAARLVSQHIRSNFRAFEQLQPASGPQDGRHPNYPAPRIFHGR